VLAVWMRLAAILTASPCVCRCISHVMLGLVTATIRFSSFTPRSDDSDGVRNARFRLEIGLFGGLRARIFRLRRGRSGRGGPHSVFAVRDETAPLFGSRTQI